ncbi:HAD domain-containing protein [Streptomyces albogriseolus]|uniref:HAD domain-containing protein n=1 Tax=Streptomyces albogriseolus TaxID=1887 RepID=UPI0038281F0E
MTRSSERPLLFLDVDGPLIPFRSSAGHSEVAATSSTIVEEGNPLLARLDPGIGERLIALGCQVVWATTWMEEANEVVAPRIGLPKLPVLVWPDADVGGTPRGLHWKTRPMVEWAACRPFIWIDDEISAMDRLWVDAGHPGPSLLHQVDPAKGLEDSDFHALAGWLDAVTSG